MLRQGLEAILRRQDDIDVVASTASTSDAMEKLGELNPQIIVLGLNGTTEEDPVQEISAKTDSKILILAPPGAEKDVAEAFNHGASGCLLTDVVADDLIETIRLIARGKMVLPQELAQEALVERRQRTRQAPKVSPRELEVLELMAGGLSNREIADELHLSEVTVKTHVSRILRKLDKKNRISAILYASRQGWINLP